MNYTLTAQPGFIFFTGYPVTFRYKVLQYKTAYFFRAAQWTGINGSVMNEILGNTKYYIGPNTTLIFNDPINNENKSCPLNFYLVETPSGFLIVDPVAFAATYALAP